MSALPDFVIPLDDYTETINMMVYADPGVGKTVFAGSARTLIIATEHGTVSAARQGAAKNGSKMVDCVNNWPRVEETYEWLKIAAGEPDFPFDWVAIDTGTEMQSLILEDIVENDADSDPDRNRYKVELQEWGEQQQKLRSFVKKFNDLPVNTLWLAHAMQTEDEEGNEFRMPQFHGKGNQVAMWVCAQMHAYGYMHVVTITNKETGAKRKVRRIQWRADEKFRAKDRFDCLGISTTGLTLAQITKKIEDSASIEEPTKKAPAKAAAKKEN
jgi:hypothetical protein